MNLWHSYEVTSKQVLFEWALTPLNVKFGNPGTWAAGYSNPNLVRRRGSRIFPMQTRLHGWFSLVSGWGGHINNVSFWFQSRFQSARHQGWNVWCWLTPGQDLTCTWVGGLGLKCFGAVPVRILKKRWWERGHASCARCRLVSHYQI